MTNPAAAEAMLREAWALDRQGRAAEAVAAYQAMLARWPDLTDGWYSLAFLQRRLGQFEAALAAYQQALDRGVRAPEEVHLNRGVIYADHLQRFDAAERELAAALSKNPTYVPALLNLANLHEDLGRRAAACALYERILEIEPRHFEALARYANVGAGVPDDGLVERLRGALAGGEPSVADRASLGFALGRALDARGAYPEAFAAYAGANRDSRRSAVPGTANYDRQLVESYVDALIASHPAPTAARSAAPAAVPATAPAFGPQAAVEPSGARPRPVFICGMFRSGSTLLEQLLAGHPRIAAAGELGFVPLIAQELAASRCATAAALPPERREALAARYRNALAALAPGADSVTDKRPDNFFHIGLIKQLFPAAKIVHTVRDPLDTCLSIFFLHLDQRLSYALDLMDIGHQYRQYRRLMSHWRILHGADILDVSYDALVREPRPLLEQLLAFLGLPFSERCLTVPPSGRAVRTASVWQVRQPLYRHSSGRARHYARELAELARYLEQPG